MNYGQLVDTYEPEKEFVYESFCSYFNNPVMTKIKDVGQYSMYMAKNHCLLSKECQYIICVRKTDQSPIGTTEKLATFEWDSLQTRTLTDNHNLPAHHYTPARKGPLKAKITRTEKNTTSSCYSCEDLPITVTLLNKDSNSEYPDTGTVMSALETYKTIITLN